MGAYAALKPGCTVSISIEGVAPDVQTAHFIGTNTTSYH